MILYSIMAHRSPTGGNVHILGSKHNLSKPPSPRGVADLSPQNQLSPQYNKKPEREDRRVQNEQPQKDPLKLVENSAFLKANSIFLFLLIILTTLLSFFLYSIGI